MGDKTKIEWTDATWNPIRGCTKCSPACANCYAKTFLERNMDGSGLGFEPRTVPGMLAQPLRWKRPRRIFVSSLSDLFHESFSFEYIAAVFGVMAACPQHTFLVLTKRPERVLEWMQWIEDLVSDEEDSPYTTILSNAANYLEGEAWDKRIREMGIEVELSECETWPLPNVRIGVTAENQEMWDRRVDFLLQIPAAGKFVSIEPMLGPIKLELLGTVPGAYVGGRYTLVANEIQHIIVGGESGPMARPMHPAWVRSIRDECKDAGVAWMLKQWGEWCPKSHTEKRHPWHAEKCPENKDIGWPIQVDACPHRWGTITEGGEFFEMATPFNGHDDDGMGEAVMYRIGKHRTGCFLDGVEHKQMLTT